MVYTLRYTKCKSFHLGESKLVVKIESGVISASHNHKHWTTYGKIGHQNLGPGPEVIKLFSCSTQLSMKFQLLIKARMLKNNDFFFAVKLLVGAFILLINVKQLTIVVILT